MTLPEQMEQIARHAREASRQLARLDRSQKDACLEAMAEALEARSSEILEANGRDLEAGTQAGLSPAMLDRLRLDSRRIAAMAKGLREVAVLPDPVGRILDERVRPNGLRLVKRSVPIGVIVIIYESRPNVTVDAASLCFKSGNAAVLRGGKEALNSNLLLGRLLVEAGRTALPDLFPAHAIQLVPTPQHEAIPALLALPQYVDLCLPRGGEGLIRTVTECSRVPVIKHYRGICHVYVDGEADLGMAEGIVLNAKCQRPAVCNAMETLLVDAAVADAFLPRLAACLGERGVELRLDSRAARILEVHPPIHAVRWRPVSEQDWATEYNDLILNVGVVEGVEQAIRHISRHGSSHSDSIVTRNDAAARRFVDEVDSAAVYWNASTRFTDGGEFGMGAEIGISTDKVGARGPMGLDELTSYKWIGFGNGQVRT